MINLQITFKEVASYRESFYVQIPKHVGNNNFGVADTDIEETIEEDVFIS